MYVSSGTESNGPIYFEFRRQRNIILSIDVAACLPAKKQSKMHFTAASLVMTDFRIASMTNHNKSQKLDLQLWSVSNFMCCFSLPFVFVKLKISHLDYLTNFVWFLTSQNHRKRSKICMQRVSCDERGAAAWCCSPAATKGFYNSYVKS